MTDDIPPEQIARITPTLDALYEAFRPLLKELPLAYTESE